ncbi:MAG: hypothetical protein KatS3mg077_0378 [Candidatus Binatia bacterium]|nr:MAG: hypothetical protein KatS3mg077_0378 [Candidatus Binatia bacterium]
MRTKAFVVVLVASVLLACGDDGDREEHDPPNPSASPIATRTPTATPTPTVRPAGHDHIVIGSHHAGGGELVAHFDFKGSAAELHEKQCVGGSGDTCAGGLIVYSGTSPAFESVAGDAAEEHLQPLLQGTAVEIEIVDISPNVQVQFDSAILDRAGARTTLGVAPFHVHGSWQLVLPFDADPGSVSAFVSFRFLPVGRTYEPSMPYTLELRVTVP